MTKHSLSSRVNDMTSLKEHIHLELPSSFKYLRLLAETISAILSTMEDIPDHEQVVYGVQLAVHEACANIVEHAYGEDHPEGRIHVTFNIADSPRRLLIELFDTGVSFNESQAKPPDLNEPQVGGYGLFLIHQLMDEVHYEARQDGNYLRLTKML